METASLLCCHQRPGSRWSRGGPLEQPKGFPFLVLSISFSMTRTSHPLLKTHCQTEDYCQLGHSSSDMNPKNDLQHWMWWGRLEGGRQAGWWRLAGKDTDRGNDWLKTEQLRHSFHGSVPTSFPGIANLQRSGQKKGMW